MASTLHGLLEADVHCAYGRVIITHNMTCSYSGIVTVWGQSCAQQPFTTHLAEFAAGGCQLLKRW